MVWRKVLQYVVLASSTVSLMDANKVRADDLPPCSWHLQVQGQRFVAGQSADPHQALQAVQIQDQLWINGAGDYLTLTHSEWPGGIIFEYRQFATSQGGARVDLPKWRDGVFVTRSTAEKARLDYVDQSYLLPSLLQAQLSLLDESATASQVRRQRHGKDAAGRAVTAEFNEVGQLLAIEHAQARYDYLGYSEPQIDSQPASIQIRRSKVLVADLKVTRQVEELPADFAVIPAGYVDKPSAKPLRATHLAPGVYRVDGSPSGYHTGFVVGKAGIAVFDAPIDEQEAATIKALIQRTAPGLPIRHLVLSHSHRDHVGGTLAMVDANTQIWVGAGGAAALQRLYGDKLSQRVAQVSAVTALSLGDRTIALWPLHSSHAQDMVVAADPQTGTVFQGDLFYLPEVGPIPPAFPLTDELLRVLHKELPAWQRMIGVHGRTATPADVQTSLQLRANRTKPKATAL